MIDLFLKTTRRWQRDEAPLQAAAVSYYLALSLFPVLLVLTSALGVFFKWTDSGHDARIYLLQTISDQVAPALADAVEQTLVHVENYSTVSGPIGIAILLFSALAIFAQFESAFARIWNSRSTSNLTWVQSIRHLFQARLRAFALMCAMGLMVIAVFVANVALKTVQSTVDLNSVSWLWWAAELSVEVGLNALAVATLYRFLPTVPIHWRHAWRGGLFVACVWEVGLIAVSRFVIGSHYASAYGVIGGFLAIMLWNYYAVAIILYGAELVRELDASRGTNPAMADGAAIHAAGSEFATTGAEMPTVGAAMPAAVPTVSGANGGRHPQDRQPTPQRAPSMRFGWLADAAFASAILYLAAFLTLRHVGTQTIPSVASPDAKRTVVFSSHPQGQRLAVWAFSPLIRLLPGPYEYPNSPSPNAMNDEGARAASPANSLSANAPRP
jgi:membrane protein